MKVGLAMRSASPWLRERRREALGEGSEGARKEEKEEFVWARAGRGRCVSVCD
jgi:hypothetical protein